MVFRTPLSRPVPSRSLSASARRSYILPNGTSANPSTELLLPRTKDEEKSITKKRKPASKESQEALAYPPAHYFDTHKVVAQLQSSGEVIAIPLH